MIEDLGKLLQRLEDMVEMRRGPRGFVWDGCSPNGNFRLAKIETRWAPQYLGGNPYEES